MLNSDLGEGCTSIAYAGDILVLVEGDTRVKIEARACTALDIISNRGYEAKLQFLPEKSKFISLKKTRSLSVRRNVKMDGVQLAFAETLVLGLR